MRTVRRAELANTVVLYRFEQTRSLKPRRRMARRQAGICAPRLGQPIYVGPPAAPRHWIRQYDHVAAVLALLAIIAVALYATGNKIEVWNP